MASASSIATDTASICSESSTLIDGSVISTVPDRHGFLGGQQYSPEQPKEKKRPETVLGRERKWIKMISKWNFYIEKNYEKVRDRCRKGIPMSIRPKAWLYLCGGHLLLEKHPNRYQTLLQQQADPKALEDIKKDLHRQFPYHEMFISEDKPGQQELFNILKAYVVLNPSVGYCQAQAPIAAFLLMHMPSEHAFWSLVSISDRYLKDYYSPSMQTIQRDGQILEGLLKRTCPKAFGHLKKYSADPLFYCTEWFLCAFTRTLPWDSLLRIWDVFLCEGVKVLFKTALVILEGCLGKERERKECEGLCETLNLLRNPPQEVLNEEYLMRGLKRLKLTVEDFEMEHRKQEKKRRKTQTQTNNR